MHEAEDAGEERPVALPPGLVEALLCQADSRGCVRLSGKLPVGQQVRILAGTRDPDIRLERPCHLGDLRREALDDAEIHGRRLDLEVDGVLPGLVDVLAPYFGAVIAATPDEGRAVVERYHAPGGPGVRMDSHMYEGYEVPPFYDSLLAKLIASGRDRDQALKRLRSALERLVIEGVTTTVPLHLAVVQDPDFIVGGVDTTWFPRFLRRR